MVKYASFLNGEGLKLQMPRSQKIKMVFGWVDSLHGLSHSRQKVRTEWLAGGRAAPLEHVHFVSVPRRGLYEFCACDLRARLVREKFWVWLL